MKYPILLDASHHLTTIVVCRCHERVMHRGVKFRRFVARRSRPSLVVSDNAKTLKSACKELEKITNDLSVVKYFAQERIKWSYNLEKAPRWGGFYERLVKSLTRCLKKTIG